MTGFNMVMIAQHYPSWNSGYKYNSKEYKNKLDLTTKINEKQMMLIDLVIDLKI